MQVCLIRVEIFINKSGGFGRATRTIGRELARRGIDVRGRNGTRSIRGCADMLGRWGLMLSGWDVSRLDALRVLGMPAGAVSVFRIDVLSLGFQDRRATRQA